MSGRVFLFVLGRRAAERFAVYHDEPPSKEQLAACGPVLWRQELAEPERGLNLGDLEGWYRAHVEFGTLPADNLTRPPAARRDERGVLLELAPRESAVDFFARRNRGDETP